MNKKILVVSACLGLLPLSLSASALPDGPHIETTGTASIDVQPDMAVLSIRVSATAKKSAEAKALVDGRVARYFSFLEQMKVDKKDISAANVSTSAEYDYSRLSQAKIKGYQASRVISVKVLDLDKLNPILDGALEAQLNEIESVKLDVLEPELHQAKARAKAIANATQQAQSLADGFGVKLGNVYRISYQVSEPVITMTRFAASDAESSMISKSYDIKETYQQESIKFTDQVSVVFDIQR